jgi:hypothetical protein
MMAMGSFWRLGFDIEKIQLAGNVISEIPWQPKFTVAGIACGRRSMPRFSAILAKSLICAVKYFLMNFDAIKNR